MSIAQRVFWGLMAGAAIVLVKVLGPDQPYVKSLFVGGTAADMTFYAFISVLTVLLGAISGSFSKEKDRVKLMLFCASVPGLLSTATAVQRDPVAAPPPPSPSANADRPAAALPSGFFLVNAAMAQSSDDEFVCKEASFLEQFSQSAKSYLSGAQTTDTPQYSVVVWSTQDLNEAKGVADRLSREPGDWQPAVGCRRPDNAFYPVMIGPTKMTQIEAAQWLGRFVEAGFLSEKPYLSNYIYRTPIYTPSG